MPAAVTLRALYEGIPVRLDTHSAAVLEDRFIGCGHGNITDLIPPLVCIVRPVSLHLGNDFFQV